MDKICKVSNCSNLHFARGFCRPHYDQNRRYGKVLEKKLRSPLCKVVDCGRKKVHRGYCEDHIVGLKGSKNLEEPKSQRATWKGCNSTGCENRHYGKGYCQKHYAQWKKHGTVGMDRVTYPDRCTVVGCNRWHCDKGLCAQHLYRFNRGRDLTPSGAEEGK